MENNASKHRMISKRILLLSILFSILIISGFVLYLLQGELHSSTKPLRKDDVPSDASVVPWMQPNPTLDDLGDYSVETPPWDPDLVMTGALKLNITFTIYAGNVTRVVPSTVYLGHDSQYLYVGGKFCGMYKNPTSQGDNAFANIFAILFDADNDGILTFPEAGSVLGVFLYNDADWHTDKVWTSDDLLWSNESDWTTGTNFYFPHTDPALAIKDSLVEYDNSTGTLIVLFSRYLWRAGDSLVNSIQMRAGERWTLGFMLMLGYTNENSLFPSFLAQWPHDYSFQSNDSSWWPKLSIDLSNPPATYPGVPL